MPDMNMKGSQNKIPGRDTAARSAGAPALRKKILQNRGDNDRIYKLL